jgi:endonuclease G
MLLDNHDPAFLADAIARYHTLEKQIEKTRQQIHTGFADEAEDPERLRKFAERERALINEEIRLAPLVKAPYLGMERALGPTHDILSIEFLEAGLIAARAVGLISVMGGLEFGTGFLVGKDLLLTNHHVLGDASEAEASHFELDREDNRYGEAKRVERFEFDPVRFFAADKALDFALVALKPVSENGRNLAEFGYHPLVAQEGKIRIGDAVNLIQHPNGGMKSVVVHNSQFLYLDNTSKYNHYCWYTSDTEPGSSGSPVFNNRWEVVALHHKGVPKTNAAGKLLDRDGKVISKSRLESNPDAVVWIANEGLRVSRLVKKLMATELQTAQAELRDELLALWTRGKNLLGAEATRGTRRATSTALESGSQIAIDCESGTTLMIRVLRN